MQAAVSLGDVLARPDVWRGDRLANAGASGLPALSSGFAALDAELPGGGWPRGSLTEILSDRVGLGECALLLPALRRMREDGKWCLLVAPPYALHGPAWASAGIGLARLAVVTATQQRDALWAAEQALASGALGAVLCWATHGDAAQVRRLQVAAAGSNSLAFLFRPARARTESSAAALRLLVSAGTRGTLGVDLLKRRGPPCTRTLYLDVARPLKWREEYESTLARPASAAPRSRSQRPGAIVVA